MLVSVMYQLPQPLLHLTNLNSETQFYPISLCTFNWNSSF